MAVELTWLEEHAEDSLTLEAVVTGVTTRTEIFSELLGALPGGYGSLVFNKIESAKLLEGTTDVWFCRVKYAAFREKRELQAGESEFRFNSAQRSITRTLSPSSKVFDSSGDVTASTPDAHLIGFKGISKGAEGTEDTEYYNSFSWRVAVPFSSASESWRRQAGALRNSINQSSFFAYDAGEVLFTNISGSVKGSELYTFELEFAQGENPGDLNIGGIAVTGVQFWDVLDIDDQEWVEIPDKNIIVPKVRRVKVHSIKPQKDWSLLAAVLGMA